MANIIIENTSTGVNQEINNTGYENVLRLPFNDTFYKETLDIDDMPGMATGTASMINKYSVFSLSKVSKNTKGKSDEYNSDLHFDITKIVNPEQFRNSSIVDNFQNENFKPTESQYPTASKIIQNSQNKLNPLTGYYPYSLQDFMYCKYYGKVPNNMLVTLRRYPMPVYDNAQTPDGTPLVPVAQAITYFGENTDNLLSNLMKFSYGLVWEEIESEVQNVDGNERGYGSGIEGLLSGNKITAKAGAATALLRGADQNTSAGGRWDGSSEQENIWLKKAWESQGPYWNQVYGPVNVVHKSHKRGRGMNFKHDVTIKFTYSLRSYNGINPRVAMMDIISNFLLLTYNNAKFWGGATRYFPDFQDSVGFLGDQNKFYSGDYDGYFDSVKNELKTMGNKLMSTVKKAASGDFSDIKELAQGALGMAMGKLAKQTRPHILSIRNLLTGNPVGEWHLVIGNPLDPIAVMGNMLVDNVEYSVSDTLGADDFPNEVSFDVKLKHGRPRDLGDIESMFNMGMGKMSYSPLVSLPSELNTHGDASNKNSQKQIDKPNLFSEDIKTMNSQQLVDKYIGDGYSKVAYNRIKNRLGSEWGNQYGDSKHLVYLISKTGAKF